MRSLMLLAGALAVMMMMLSACVPGQITLPLGPQNSASPTQTGESPTPAPTEAAASTDPNDLTGAVLTAAGLGPITLGMELSEAQSRGFVVPSDLCSPWVANDELTEQGVEIGINQNDQIDNIWVTGDHYPTDAGARAGMTFDQLYEIYGEDLLTEVRQGNGGPFDAWYVLDGDQEILFIAEEEQANTIKAMIARTYSKEAYGNC